MQQMYTCPNCGAQVTHSRFCRTCGTELDWSGQEIPPDLYDYRSHDYHQVSGDNADNTGLKKRKKLGIILAGLAVFLVVGTGVVLAAGGISSNSSHNPANNPTATNPPDNSQGSSPQGTLPVVNFLRSNPSVIPAGQMASLNWDVSGATAITIDQSIGTVSSKGTKSVSPAKTTTYVLTATNSTGSVTESVIVTVNSSMPFVSSFTASPDTVKAGQSSTLRWNVTGANTINIQGIGNVSSSGSQVVNPVSTTTYTLSATNDAGIATATATVTMTSTSVPVITSFTASAESISAGQSVTLEWYVTGATSVSIDHSVGTVSSLGSKVVTPSANTTYVLTATNSAGSSTASAAVTVTSTSAPVINSFSASPFNILSGGSSTLQWNVNGATSISIDQSIGAVSAVGTRSVSPSATTIYMLTAINSNGSVTRTATVNVSTITAPVIVSFTATPPNISSGQSSNLHWDVTGADSVSINNGVVIPSGFFVYDVLVYPAVTTIYTLTATNVAGSTTDNVTVTVSSQ